MRPLPSLFIPLLACVGVVAALAGCSYTSGKSDRATFSYDPGSGCLFGCSTTRPLMVGTSERLVVGGLPANAGAVLSSAPGVLGVAAPTLAYECDSQTAASGAATSISASDICPIGSTKSASMAVSVTALGPGEATLDVYTLDGALFDSLHVVVGAPVQLELLDPSYKAVTAITVADGAEVDLAVLALDVQGNQLQASSGFAFQVADPAIVDTQAHDFTKVTPALPVHGDAPGATTISVSASGLATSVAVTVQ